MCQLDANVEPLFVKTVAEFVEQRRAFTGYDLTLRTRDREKSRIRHNDVKQGIHEMQTLVDLVEFDDWHKELHDLGNGVQALLYYPDGYDKSKYQPLAQQPFVPSPTASLTSVPVSTTPAVATGTPLGSDDDDDDADDADDAGGPQPDGTFKCDYRGRLLVSKQFLQSAGANPGDMVAVAIVPDQITLTVNNTLAPGDDNAKQVEQHSGRVYLWRNALQAAGLGTTGIKIENQNGSVVISKA